jgi:hypothetical protein
MSQLRLIFDGDTGYPVFTAGQISKIREIASWFGMCAKVADKTDAAAYRNAVDSLHIILNRFPKPATAKED